MMSQRPTLTPAALCRARNWAAGTLLADLDDPAAPIIRITEVGETAVLARRISFDGHPCQDVETTWDLRQNAWRPYSAPPSTI